MMRALLILFTLFQTSNHANACSAVQLPQSREKIVVKSYDWFQKHGVALVNPRGLEKVALTLKPGDKPAQWTSKFGSVTFNQHGRELPLSGMNEKGLVVEILWLEDSVYPPADNRPVLNELQWIQYQLDNYSSTDEVVRNAHLIRVAPAVAEVHYMTCDANGQCAIYEFIDGEMVIHPNNKMKIRTLTNDTYADSLEYISDYDGFGGSSSIPWQNDSLSRFVRASHNAQKFEKGDSTDELEQAFNVLKKVKNWSTVWNLAYETQSKRIHFRTRLKWSIKSVDLEHFDFDCQNPAQWLDMNEGISGNVNADFEEFQLSDNADLVDEGLYDFEDELPPGTLDKVAAYPATLNCSRQSN